MRFQMSTILSDQITFAGNHNLATGQAVVYHAGNVSGSGIVTNVGGLMDGQVYYVIKVDNSTIQLASSLENANSGTFINTLAPIPSATTNVDSLTTARSFSESDIDNDNIVFTSDPGLAVGQAVVFNQGSGSSLTGPTNGQIYYVKPVSGNPNAIQLALTPELANDPLGAVVALSVPATSPDMLDAVSFIPSPTSVVNSTIIFPSATTLTDGQSVVYHKGSGNNSIGLIDGQVYYVKLVSGNPNAIQLALTVGGLRVPLSFAPAVDTLTPTVSFDPLAIDVQNDQITFTGNHNLLDGQKVDYRVGNWQHGRWRPDGWPALLRH